MDMSPLPHKAPFATHIHLASPTPEHTPNDEVTVAPPKVDQESATEASRQSAPFE